MSYLSAADSLLAPGPHGSRMPGEVVGYLFGTEAGPSRGAIFLSDNSQLFLENNVIVWFASPSPLRPKKYLSAADPLLAPGPHGSGMPREAVDACPPARSASTVLAARG